MSHGSTAPAVGNAVTQLARAQGAGKAISTTTNPAKAAQARALGFDDVIDLSAERLADGVALITAGASMCSWMVSGGR
jgi:NADPH:quinone reductase